MGILLSLLCVAGAQAATVTLVLSDDTAPYIEAADAIEAALTEHTVIRVQSDRLAADDSALSRAKMLVAIGVGAAKAVAERGGRTPLLAVLVTEDWYREEGRALLARGGRSAGVLVLEQPFSRQFQLVRQAFPEVRKVGVLVGPGNARQLAELEKAAIAQQLSLISATVESETRLVAALTQVLSDSDLLLTIPDPDLINRNTIQSILMTTYRYRDPAMGYSQSMTRAGALLSLHSSPRQIGRQAGEIVPSALAGGKLSGLYWPRYFSISINNNVARSLSISLPTEEVLSRSLGAEHD